MKKTLLGYVLILSLAGQTMRAVSNFEICMGVGAATAVAAHTALTYSLTDRDDRERETFIAGFQSVAMFGMAIGGSWLIDKYYCMRPFNGNEIVVRACTMSIAGSFIAQAFQRINAKLAKKPKA